MSLDTFIQIATLVSIVVGIYAFFQGVNSYKRQMNAQVFLQYTGRYEEIMKSYPKSAWSARFNSDEALPESTEELTMCALRYINLCSEEFYLHDKKYLSEEVWAIWEKEMVRTLRTPLYRREWIKLVDEFDAYSEFQSFVKMKQK